MPYEGRQWPSSVAQDAATLERHPSAMQRSSTRDYRLRRDATKYSPSPSGSMAVDIRVHPSLWRWTSESIRVYGGGYPSPSESMAVDIRVPCTASLRRRRPAGRTAHRQCLTGLWGGIRQPL